MFRLDVKTDGKAMVAKGFLTEDQIEKAESESLKTGVPWDKTLLKMGFISEEVLASFMAERQGVPFIDLSQYIIDPEVIKIVPESLAKRFKLVPLFKIGNSLTVAMADAKDLTAIDELHLKTGYEIDIVLSTENGIRNAIDQYYSVTGTMEDIIGEVDEARLKDVTDEAGVEALTELAGEAPVVKIVNLLIMQAVKDGASDIHIEPDENILRVRFRIDGVLHEVNNPPKHMHPAIASRIKVLSKLDIAEKRKPQDGRFSLKVEDKDIDLRVSTFPTIYGENVVMRILDKSSVLLGLKDLGFAGDDLKNFEAVIRRPYGIILVTGPTGSGKTTTLYSALQTINSPDKNIITVEDPVEYHLGLIRQTQINPKAGLTFASGLRAILRQDPDIIMVGEIRDRETAEIAVQAALTGHLVLSTLHTNDAPGALTRLIDMGIEPFLVSSSIIAVLAQRLVRIICSECKESYKGADGAAFGADVLYRGKGCKKCKNSGYKGRIGIYELMAVNESIRQMILARASADEIRKKAQEQGMTTLLKDGLTKVKAGITTLEEVYKVAVEE